MKAHTTSSSVFTAAAGSGTSSRAWRFVIDRFLLLPAGALVALLWANLHGETYFPVAQTLAFPVNEIGMAIFLALMAQEAFEALMPGGVLRSWRHWGLAVAAAGGGLVGAVAGYRSFIALTDEQVLQSAWPIAAAIDVAAGYYVLKLIAPRSAAAPLLLVVALITNAVLVLIAPKPLFAVSVGGGLIFLIAGIALGAVLGALRAPMLVIFAVAGPLTWIGLYLEGFHPGLALVPLVPFLRHEARRSNPFADPDTDDQVHRFEHRWNGAVQIVLFFFGLVNAGVLIGGIDTGTWAVLAAAVAGRPLGILAAIAIAVAFGLRLPGQMGWRGAVILALATSSGFTFALFFATSLLPPGPVLMQIKAGALLTAGGALLTLAVARAFGRERAGRGQPVRHGQVIL
jgi:NhaA family Na+:H+ antiporter